MNQVIDRIQVSGSQSDSKELSYYHFVVCPKPVYWVYRPVNVCESASTNDVSWWRVTIYSRESNDFFKNFSSHLLLVCARFLWGGTSGL